MQRRACALSYYQSEKIKTIHLVLNPQPSRLQSGTVLPGYDAVINKKNANKNKTYDPYLAECKSVVTKIRYAETWTLLTG